MTSDTPDSKGKKIARASMFVAKWVSPWGLAAQVFKNWSVEFVERDDVSFDVLKQVEMENNTALFGSILLGIAAIAVLYSGDPQAFFSDFDWKTMPIIGFLGYLIGFASIVGIISRLRNRKRIRAALKNTPEPSTKINLEPFQKEETFLGAKFKSILFTMIAIYLVFNFANPANLKGLTNVAHTPATLQAFIAIVGLAICLMLAYKANRDAKSLRLSGAVYSFKGLAGLDSIIAPIMTQALIVFLILFSGDQLINYIAETSNGSVLTVLFVRLIVWGVQMLFVSGLVRTYLNIFSWDSPIANSFISACTGSGMTLPNPPLERFEQKSSEVPFVLAVILMILILIPIDGTILYHIGKATLIIPASLLIFTHQLRSYLSGGVQ